MKMVEKIKKDEKKKEEVRKPVTAQKLKPQVKCTDKKCPIHGGLRTRGRVFEGVIVSDKMLGTIKVEWARQFYIPKYERYEKRRSRVMAHLPSCIAAHVGDWVKIAECRPLSKTVKFVVVEKIKRGQNEQS